MTDLFLRAHTVPVGRAAKSLMPAGHPSRVAERLHVVVGEHGSHGTAPYTLVAWRTLKRTPSGRYSLAIPLTLDAPAAGLVARKAIGNGDLPVLDLQEYIHSVFFRETYKAAATFCAYHAFAMVSSLATSWAPTRDRRGWTFRFCPALTRAERAQRRGRYSHPACPGITATPGRPPITFLSFTRPMQENWFYRVRPHHGRFFSLRTQVYVLTGEDLPNEDDALRLFGIDAPARTPDRVGTLLARLDATCALAEAILSELRRHPVLYDTEPIRPCRWMGKTLVSLASPVDLGKAYLREGGISSAPPLRVVPPCRMTAREVYGAAASAFHAPRSEVLIRHTPVPGVMLDIRSCYSASAILQGVSGWWAAEGLTAEEIPLKDALAHLDAATPEHYLGTPDWSDLTTLYLVRGRGLFPVTTQRRDGDRVHYDASWARVTLPEPVWFAKTHVLLSRWRGERGFEVLRVLRIRACGRRPGIHSIRFRGEYEFDPTRPVKSLVAIRHDLAARGLAHLAGGAKVAANGIGYGIAAQFQRRPGREVFVYDGVRAYRARPGSIDAPGSHTCWLIATFTVAGSWMLLELAEHVGRKAGGELAFCFSDSAFFASQNGVPPSRIARAVMDAMEPLNPFAGVVAPFLKPQDGTSAAPRIVAGFGVSTPAYTRYVRRKGTHGARVTDILKPNGHGLSTLLAPAGETETSFRKTAWRSIIAPYHRGRKPRLPAWMDTPAVEPLIYASPSQTHEVHRLRYADGSPLRPGAVVYRRHYWTEYGEYRTEIVLSPDAPLRAQRALPNDDLRTPREPGEHYVTYRRAIALHAERPEYGMTDPQGKGRLERHTVEGMAIRHTGKDDPPMVGQDTTDGAVATWDDVLVYEKVPRPGEVRAAVTILRQFPTAAIARLLGVSRRRLPHTLRYPRKARPQTCARIVALAEAIRRTRGRLP